MEGSYFRDYNVANCALSDHGSLVSGVAGAVTNNSFGVAGVGGDWAKLVPIRISDCSERIKWYLLFEGLEWILAANENDALDSRNNIKVINISFSSAGNCTSSFFQHLRDLIGSLSKKGIAIVAAAGNQNTKSGRVPASCDNVISVGSIKNDGSKAESSNYGDFVHIAAPGKDIYSTSKSNGFRKASGTSFSSPFVAGVVAMMYAADPNLNSKVVDSILQQQSTIYDDIYGLKTIDPTSSVRVAKFEGAQCNYIEGTILDLSPGQCTTNTGHPTLAKVSRHSNKGWKKRMKRFEARCSGTNKYVATISTLRSTRALSKLVRKCNSNGNYSGS